MSVVCASASIVRVVGPCARGRCDVKVGDDGVSLGVSGGKATDTWTRTYTVRARRTARDRQRERGDRGLGRGRVGVEVRSSGKPRRSDEAAREALQSGSRLSRRWRRTGDSRVRDRGGRSGASGAGQVSVTLLGPRSRRDCTRTFRTENGAVSLRERPGPPHGEYDQRRITGAGCPERSTRPPSTAAFSSS